MIAPHPDDETLGAGGLIAALAQAGADVTVAFLTDGSGSHVGAPGWSPRRVASARLSEGTAALRALGHKAAPVTLGWHDAAPDAEGSPRFIATVRRLVALCRQKGIRRVVATWDKDPHCDHVAAAQVAGAVAHRLHVTPLFYAVWAWTLPDLDAQLAPVKATAMPLRPVRGRVRRALGFHRTQLGGRISGANERFVLPRPMRRLVDTTHALLLEHRHAP